MNTNETVPEMQVKKQTPNPAQRASPAEILAALAAHRGWLLGIYLSLTVLGVTIALFFPESFRDWLDDPKNAEWNFTPGHWLLKTLFIAGFFLPQALFLWGGGKIHLRMPPVRKLKRIPALLIFVILMTTLTVMLSLVLVDMTDLGDNDDASFYIGLSFFASILIWLVAGVCLLRGTSQRTGLSKLILVIQAGCWIESAAALPVYYALRVDSGSANASIGVLVICIFFSLWGIGPALYLYYLREKELCKTDPYHACLILCQKTEARRGWNRMKNLD